MYSNFLYLVIIIFLCLAEYFDFSWVLTLSLKLRKQKLIKYIDGIVLSFLFVLFIWYVWALFWWQVYGRETSIWLEILYSNPNSNIPYEFGVFPLPIVYSVVFFIEFCLFYTLSNLVSIRWFVAYLWLITFSSTVLILEFFSWKYDIFRDNLGINLSQILAIVIISISSYFLYKLIKNSDNKDLLITK